MTEDEFRRVLCDAMNEEYKWVPNPEDLEYEYTFSKAFEYKIHRLIAANSSDEKWQDIYNTHEIKNIWVSHRTLRKMSVVIIVSVMILAFAACTAIYAVINWNESQNNEQGTLDVTFDIEKKNTTAHNFKAKQPETPQGFELIKEEKDLLDVFMLYESGDHTIYYSQSYADENTGLSIDSDDESFTDITINGYKGYAVTESESPYIIWYDGYYLYYISGNVPYNVLDKMARSVK